MFHCLLLLQVQDSSAIKIISKNSQTFQKIDPWGIGMTFIGMSVVFLSLLLLYILFYNVTRLLNYKFKLLAKRSSSGMEGSMAAVFEEMPDEVNAAIALALHLHLKEIHDYESTVLTINRVSRTYSPWSSKIYGLRHFPRN